MNLRRSAFMCFAVVALLSALPLCVQSLRAQQWQRVTTKPIFWMSNAISGGAMTYKDGIVWAGAGDVKKSTDLGLTWTATSCPKGVVYRIVFFNDSIGVVCMLGYGVFLTTDQGTKWSHVLDSTSTYDAAFGVTPDTILVTTYQDLRRTTNRGAKWTYCYGTAELGPISSRNGTFYYKNHSRLFASTNAGTSWGSQPGVADYDCHSWSFDSCDASTIYVVDEALYWPDDTDAGMYVTRDLGVTWSLRNPQPRGYYCGNIATSNLAIYTQISNGVLCSSNKGVTWRNIGGPAGQPDQQVLRVRLGHLKRRVGQRDRRR